MGPPILEYLSSLESRTYLLDEADKRRSSVSVTLFAHWKGYVAGSGVILCKAPLYECRLQSTTTKELSSGPGYEAPIT